MLDQIYTKIRAMEKVLSDIREEATKFDRGNMLAGTRIRKGLQEIKKQAQDIRIEILTIRKKKKHK